MLGGTHTDTHLNFSTICSVSLSFLELMKVFFYRTKKCVLLIGTSWYSIYHKFSQLFAWQACEANPQ